jgi:acyl-CoA reductase-like NAD-dependent aldehyde dehydrogenase
VNDADSPAPRFQRLNPVTGSVASTALAMTLDEACAVADAVAIAQGGWAAFGPSAKRECLYEVGKALHRRTDDLVAAMTAEIGASEGWAHFNVRLAVSIFSEAASLTTGITGTVIPSDRLGCLSMAIPCPVGVVLSIAPWNAPVILGVRSIATPLACGNGVVFKASEICPRTHEIIVEACAQGGLPQGLVGLVTHAPEDAAQIVGALIDHPCIRRINFTGSTAVGRIIAQRAAARLKPVLLELGGKAPMLVLHDANLSEAVKAAAFGAFMNQGQICMSTERIIVADAIADEFIRQFRDKASTLKAADPRKSDAALGAVVDLKTVMHIQQLIADATGKGAVLVCGGGVNGLVMQPNVVDGVTHTMRLYHEESFGPVVAIIRAHDEAEAIRLANDTEYGLSAAVFTRDIARGIKIASQIQSGICHINGATVHDEAQMPFGGVKGSGYGRFGGAAAIREFTDLRWLTIETEPAHFPI